MSDGFGTTTETMAMAGSHVLDVNDSVQNELGALRGKLAPLAGLWQGAASVQFAQLMQRWDTNARTLSEALRGIGESIKGSATSYDVHDEDERRALSTINAALG